MADDKKPKASWFREKLPLSGLEFLSRCTATDCDGETHEIVIIAGDTGPCPKFAIHRYGKWLGEAWSISTAERDAEHIARRAGWTLAASA